MGGREREKKGGRDETVCIGPRLRRASASGAGVLNRAAGGARRRQREWRGIHVPLGSTLVARCVGGVAWGLGLLPFRKGMKQNSGRGSWGIWVERGALHAARGLTHARTLTHE